VRITQSLVGGLAGLETIGEDEESPEQAGTGGEDGGNRAWEKAVATRGGLGGRVEANVAALGMCRRVPLVSLIGELASSGQIKAFNEYTLQKTEHLQGLTWFTRHLSSTKAWYSANVGTPLL
jgi:hypothetical protein